MGRAAGDLALGIGKAAGATLTIVPEEFIRPGPLCRDLRRPRRLDHQSPVDGAPFRHRGARRRPHRQARIPAELAGLEDVERDEHGHVRFAEVDLARKVKAEVQGRLSERGLRITITNKNVGYELRCADPIPFDAEYRRDLGYSAVQFLLPGGAAMVSIQEGRFVPIPFDDPREPGPAGRSYASWTPTARGSESPAPT